MTVNEKDTKSRRIKWNAKGLVSLMVGIIMLVMLIVGVVGVVGKRMRLDASVMATRMKVEPWVVSRTSSGGKRATGGSSRVYVPYYYYEVEGNEHMCAGEYKDNMEDISEELQEIHYVKANPMECITEEQLEKQSEKLWLGVMVVIVQALVGIGGVVAGICSLLGKDTEVVDLITPTVQAT